MSHKFNVLGDRSKIIYYETLVPNNDILSILSYSHYMFHESPFNIFNSFTLQMWIIIIISYLIYGALNYYQTLSMTIKSNMIRLMINYFTSFGLLVGQGGVHLMETKRSTIFINPLIVWIFSSLLLRTLFSNDITAALSAREKIRIDYFSQLYEKPNLRLMVVNTSSTHFALNEKFPQLKRQLEPISTDNFLLLNRMKRWLDEHM